MILGNLRQSDLYGKLDARVAACLDYAAKLNKDTPEGRYEVCDGVYVNVSAYEPKQMSEAGYETHKLYADLQLMLDGEEYMGYADIGDIQAEGQYDAIKDIRFWRGAIAPIRVKAGSWALFLPDEPHAPGIAAGSKKVKKAVFKILW